MANYLRALAMYAPRTWGSTKAIANNRGLAGLAKDYGLPAVAGEILGKAANYATGIPEDIIDMATLSTLKKPVTNIYKNVSGLARPLYLDKVSGKPLLEIASDRTVDAIAPNVEGSTGITPEMAMQGFYKLINPNAVAATNDRQNYAGLQEWFYGSKTPLNQLPNPQGMMPNPPKTVINNAYRGY